MLVDGVEREDCLVHLSEDVEYTSPDGIFMKGMLIEKAGTEVRQHSHEYAHTSLLAAGKVRVFQWDDTLGLEYAAPAFIHIDAKVKHRFVSLVDNTHVYCIHNMSNYHLITDRPPIHKGGE